METRIHKIVSAMLALLFLVFAAVQYNDPDPEIWITVYAATAGFCLWNLFGKVTWWLALLGLVACVVFAVILWPVDYQGLSGKMDSRPGVEYARESLGLATCGLGLGYVGWRGMKRSRR